MLRHLSRQTSNGPFRMVKPANQMQNGLLLKVSFPLKPPPFFQADIPLFELAVPFPLHLFNTPELIPLKVGVWFSSIDTFQIQVRTCLDSTIIRLSHDACGYLKVLEGKTVPITETIRNSWVIQPGD